MEAVQYMPVSVQERERKHTHDAQVFTKKDTFKSISTEVLYENALVVKKEGMLQTSYPCTSDEALYETLGGIMDIAAFFAQDDSGSLNHINVLIECNGGRASLSMALGSAPHIVRHKGWAADSRIHACKVSVTVLSLTQTSVPVDYLLNRLIA